MVTSLPDVKRTIACTLRYDRPTIGEFNVNSKAEYTA